MYATGRWEKLKIPAERARFNTTGRLLVKHGPPGQVLEIGCGEALLQRQLEPAAYLGWVGIDISEVAIHRAQEFTTDRVRYHVADMERFDPGTRFDCIIFTESIYYSADSRRLLARYVRFLKPGGRIIVSIFRTKRSQRIWTGLHAVAAPIDRLATSNELGSWDCEVLVPRESPATGRIPPAGSRNDGHLVAAQGPHGLSSSWLDFWIPEGFEDKQGFHL